MLCRLSFYATRTQESIEKMHRLWYNNYKIYFGTVIHFGCAKAVPVNTRYMLKL